MLSLKNGRPGFDQVTGQNGVGAHAIEPADVHDLQPGDARPEHLDQSGRGCRFRLEPLSL